MYKVIYMKADYEPWWQFDGWEQFIVKEDSFENEKEADQYLQSLLKKFEAHYKHHEQRKECYWAFWSEEEVAFCEACDEDVQTYHGVILQKT